MRLTSSDLVSQAFARVGNSAIYARKFGPVMVSVTLPSDAGEHIGLRIDVSGDITAADAAAVAVTLAALGFRQFASWPAFSGLIS